MFQELHGQRGGGFGPSALSWGEIDAWARMTRRELDPWEVTALLKLDRTFLAFADERARKEAAKGAAK